MMAGAGEGRKTSERKPALMDVGVPFVKKARGGTGRLLQEEEDELVEGEEQTQKGMRFTLLTKKGSKQQVSFPFLSLLLADLPLFLPVRSR